MTEWHQRLAVGGEPEQISNHFNLYVGGTVLCHFSLVLGVMTLFDEHRRNAVLPLTLYRRKDAYLVVYQVVVSSWVATLDVLEFLLLMDVDQNVVTDGLAEAGPLDLARLEHRITICKDN